jgi:hypothetical protein
MRMGLFIEVEREIQVADALDNCPRIETVIETRLMRTYPDRDTIRQLNVSSGERNARELNNGQHPFIKLPKGFSSAYVTSIHYLTKSVTTRPKGGI